MGANLELFAMTAMTPHLVGMFSWIHD